VIAVTIDGRTARAAEGQTLLQVARALGVHIPTLCYHEAMTPFGACRLCVVEVETGRERQLVASCSYPCTDGLTVYTSSPAVRRSRRATVELLLATARNVPRVRQLAQELGVGEPRFTLPEDDCILCGLCVRACREIVGVGAISVINRGSEKKVSPPFRIASNECIGCGTCVLVCPTGAITLDDVCGPAPDAHRWSSDFEAVTCQLCTPWSGEREFVEPPLLAGEEVALDEAREGSAHER
jgi:NADH dehydrogenase/NADH:ubiquinone oxidoreductase subunit G